METSQLRFLDNDVSHMLCEKVKSSKEEKTRSFHSYNFENSHIIDLNKLNHYKISDVFDDESIINYFDEIIYKENISGIFEGLSKVKILSNYINAMLIEYIN